MWQPDSEIDKRGDGIYGIWPTIGLAILILIATQAAQILVSIIYTIKEIVSNPDIDPFQYSQDLVSNGLFLSIALITSSIVGIALIIFFIKRRKGYTIVEYLGLKPISKKLIFLMIGICIGFLVLSDLVTYFLGYPEDSDFFTDAYSNIGAWLPLLALAIVVFAPVFEETFFRGFLFVNLRKSPIGNAGTIIITAMLWALIHMQYGLFGISMIFALGIVLGIVRWKTGSLWAPIIIHSLWNLAALIGMAVYSE